MYSLTVNKGRHDWTMRRKHNVRIGIQVVIDGATHSNYNPVLHSQNGCQQDQGTDCLQYRPLVVQERHHNSVGVGYDIWLFAGVRVQRRTVLGERL